MKNIAPTRRTFLVSASLATLGTALHPALAAAPPRNMSVKASGPRFQKLPAALAQLEKDNGGRLGVFVLDTGSGETASHRSGERFAMCSTFKMLLAANVLSRTDAGKESLDRAIAIPASGFLGNSPITKEHAGSKMTMRDLCQAVITRSDNTAANLLLDTISGPQGITEFARRLGDTVTRLDRTEMSLNEAKPGDPRDTTSPEAMVTNWQKLLLGNFLSEPSRKQLTAWLIATTTGRERLRAGFHANWTAGDKTGSNGENTSNDVAIAWPDNQPPVIVAAYLTECPGPEDKREAVLAEVGRLVAKSIAPAA